MKVVSKRTIFEEKIAKITINGKKPLGEPGRHG
jgi:hypothetical protein